jgi:hypothetical protein
MIDPVQQGNQIVGMTIYRRCERLPSEGVLSASNVRSGPGVKLNDSYHARKMPFHRILPIETRVPRQNFTLTEASSVRGAPRWATSLPVLAPVMLLGPMVDQ